MRQGAGEQVAQPLGVDLTAGHGGVGAGPATPVDWLQAQVRQRRDRLGAHQRVAQVQQRIGAAGEAGVQLGPERGQPDEGKVGVDMAAQPDSHLGHRQPDQRKRPGQG